MKVRTQTNLVKRGTVWQFRKKVPKDLQEHYGKESIRQSLGHCPNISEAKREAGRLAAQLEAEFCSIRAAREPVPAMPLTAGMIPQLAKALHGHILTADEEIRTHGMDAEAFERWELETEEAAAEIRKAYARGDSSPIDAALSDWLNGIGVEVEPHPPLHRRFAANQPHRTVPDRSNRTFAVM